VKYLLLALALLWGAAAQAAETVALRAAPHAGYGRIVFDWKTPASYEASLAGRILTVRFARPFSAAFDIVPDRLPDHVAAIRPEGDGRTVILTLKGDYTLRRSSDGGIVILDLIEDKLAARAQSVAKVEPAAGAKPQPKQDVAPAKSDPLDAAVDRVLKPTPLASAAPPSPASENASETKLQAAPFVSVDVNKGRDIATVRFNWHESVGAAAFRRGSQAWIVFDSPSRIELGSLRVYGVPLISSAEQMAVVGGSAVRLGLDPSRHMRVRREGNAWIVDILDTAPSAGKGIEVIAEPDSGGGRLVLPLKDIGKLLRVQDPEVGTTLQIATANAPGLGVGEARRNIDVEILESAQGVAVRPISDQVTVEAQAGEIVVAKPGGLRVSRDADRLRPAVAATSRNSNNGLFDFTGWAKGPADTIAKSREELFRRAAATTNPAAKRKARLDLARFFVGNGMGPEALGVINEIVRSDAGRNEDVELRALRGVARVLAGEYALASDDLHHPVLEANPEVAPWLATIAAARGDWKTAQQHFRELESVIAPYPTWLAARMGITAAEASLAIGDTGAASARIGALDARDLEPPDRDALAVLHGYLLKLSGDGEGAIQIWQRIAASADRKAAARARFALANMLYERKEATIDETIDRMERLRYAWRGDVHEFDLLRRIAQLYTEHGDSRHALQTLKEAATYFRDIEGVEAVAKDMSVTFHHLFAEGGADKLDAVTALALFDEFRELTPAGAEGDALARKLAERLASVDLLDDAARILEQQVKFRLKGEEKASVGLRLATIRLADRKPKDALTALEESAEPNLPEALAHDRLLAQSRALAADGRDSEALALLDQDKSESADRIRAAVQWRAKAWKPAADAFANLLGRDDVAEADRPGLVISRAVALALAGDEKAIDALYAKYSDTMKKSPYKDAFNAVAGPDAGQARDFRTAARIANEISSLEAMLGQKKGSAPSAGS
jgi:hypothetical protein